MHCTTLTPTRHYFVSQLGLSVLLCRPASPAGANPSIASLGGSKASFGGKGLTISEVLRFLASASPSPHAPVRKAVPFGSSAPAGGEIGV